MDLNESSVAKQGAKKFSLSDSGNAERFATDHAETARYCKLWKAWLLWDGKRWARDDVDRVSLLAKETIRKMLAEAPKITNDDTRQKLIKHVLASESAGRRKAMVSLACAEPPLPILPDQLDVNPWLLNTPAGTIDLRTCEVREHRRSDLVTKMCPIPYDANAEAPTWQKFLRRIFDNDEKVIRYLRQLCGYSLTGDVSEQILPILYGTGANGKSSFLETLMAVLGTDYAIKAPNGLLVARRGNHHPTELTVLHGRRLVAAVETEDGSQLAESTIKELTGSDTITARRMHENFWQFTPSHKLWLATNHRPSVRGTDHAIWRRLRLIPFSVTIPEAERDLKLLDKLKNELPGILRWCVEGCLDWQSHGLATPATIRDATASYRDDEDQLASFIKDCCVSSEDAKTSAHDLLKAYHRFAGDKEMNSKRLGLALTECGIGRTHVQGRVWRTGIGLRADT